MDLLKMKLSFWEANFKEKQLDKLFLKSHVHLSSISPKTGAIKHYHQENMKDSFDFTNKSNTHNGSEQVILMKNPDSSQVNNSGFS